MKPELIILTGATASGKSAALYALPAGTPIEIINADARQVYRGMDIGTAMPTVEERQKFPHHLFRFLNPNQKMSVGLFFNEAKKLIAEIQARGNTPVICGGSFFYIKTLLDGLAPEPPIREEIQKQIAALSLTEQLEILKERDPVAFERIDRKNPVRVARALVVTLSSDKPFSAYLPQGGLRNTMRMELLCTDLTKEQLHSNIKRRTNLMFERGLIAETFALLQQGYHNCDPGLVTIGYREIVSTIEQYNLTSANDIPPRLIGQLQSEIALHTRQFAKRQLTWFRSEPKLKKVDPLQLTAYLSRCLRG